MAYEGRPASEFMDLSLIQQHLQAATDYVADASARSFRTGTEGALRHMPSLQFDSPLEVLFWIWWYACLTEQWQDQLILEPQHEVHVGSDLFRVDFLIEPSERRISGSPDWKPIAVEVDGHGFHERTREQVALRDRRDRALQAAGWKIFHFSFGEFTARPLDCVGEVFIFARNQLNLASMRDYRERHKELPPEA